MSNNCLVTKLKGTVQNDNLPELDTIYLDFFDETYRYSYTDCSYSLLIGVKSGKSVKVSALVPFHVSAVSAPAVTEYVVTNTAVVLIFVIGEPGFPKTAVKDAIKISGDIYDITACCSYNLSNSSPGSLIDFRPGNVRSSLSSLNYDSELITRSSFKGDTVQDNIQVLCIQDKEMASNVDITSMFSENNNVKYITSFFHTNMATLGVTAESISKLHNLHTCTLRINGDITELPLSIKVLYTPSSIMTGSIENFVADRRSRGLTTGNIAFRLPDISWVVTYNGIPIKDLSLEVRPKVGALSYLCWNASKIWWASEQPADNNLILDSPYWATKAVLDGEL